MSDEQPPDTSGEIPPPPQFPPPPPSYPSYPGQPGGYPGSGGPATTSTGPYNVGTAFGLGFKLFGKHAAAFLLMVLIIVVATVFFGGLGVLFSDHQSQASNGSFTFNYSLNPAQVTFQIIGNIVTTLLSAALIKGALAAADGTPVSIGGMFTGWDKLQVLIAAVVVNVLVIIGLVLLIIPGIIVLFLTWFTTFFVVDRGLPALQAITASFKFAGEHIGPILLTGLLAVVAIIIGVCLCGVGVFVAIPVTYIMAAVAFRQLQGRPVVQA